MDAPSRVPGRAVPAALGVVIAHPGERSASPVRDTALRLEIGMSVRDTALRLEIGMPVRDTALRLEIGMPVRDTALRLALYGRGTLTNLPPTNQHADL